jgi:hypothetical protein
MGTRLARRRRAFSYPIAWFVCSSI